MVLLASVCSLFIVAMDLTITVARLQEFADWVSSQDSTFEMPYAIDQDKVAGMSIRLQFNSDAKWTTALKHMLTNLKFCLSWMITKHTTQTDLPMASRAATGHSQNP